MATIVTKSIGTGTSTVKTGTINANTKFATAIVGTGTTFLTDYTTSDLIIILGYAYKIASVNSNTSITLTGNGLVVDVPGGTAHSKSGVQRDYTTLASWYATMPADLVSADQVWKAEMYNDSVFTSGMTVTGKTCDATRYT